MDDYSDPVYYRILLWKKIGKLTVVHMQSFDEYDYDQNRFLCDDAGNPMKWDDEAVALKYLNDNFKLDCIDPDCVTPNHPSFRLNYGDDQKDIPEEVR